MDSISAREKRRRASSVIHRREQVQEERSVSSWQVVAGP